LNRSELEAQAEASLELQRRYREEKIRFYQPCGPKHVQFHQSTKSVRAIFGGNRSGKTYCGLLELLFHACLKKHPFTGVENPVKGHYRIFTTKFSIAEELIIPMMQEYIPVKWYQGGSWKEAYDSTYHILYGANGTIIDIFTYDQDVAATESVTLDGCWMDEEAPERMYSSTVSRVMSAKGFIILTVTPLFGMSWALRLWRQGGTPTVDVFKFSIHDNKHLDPEYVKNLMEQWPENERAARENGDFLEFAGLVYKELDDHVHFLRDWKEPDYFCAVIFALDPHPRKPSVGVWAMLTQAETLIMFDEIEIAGTASQIVKAIKDRERGHKYQTQMRVIDPAANKQISGIGSQLTTLGELENAGMGFTLADNSMVGYDIVHEYLAYDHTKPIQAFNHPRMYFTEKAQKTWQYMKELLWDEFRFGNDMKDPKERIRDYHKDYPDCVRYIAAAKPSVDSSPINPVDLNVEVSQ
jgi:phage terminase large subunit-like protein